MVLSLNISTSGLRLSCPLLPACKVTSLLSRSQPSGPALPLYPLISAALIRSTIHSFGHLEVQRGRYRPVRSGRRPVLIMALGCSFVRPVIHLLNFNFAAPQTQTSVSLRRPSLHLGLPPP